MNDELNSLLPCDFRVSYAEVAGLHQCRHAEHFSAGDWVTDRACQVCPVRLTPCENPRPIQEKPPPPTIAAPATRAPAVAAPADRASPSFFRRAANFAAALAAHVAAGCPRATQETINERLAVCQTCDLFAGDRCTHQSCGCHINGAKKFLNKLAWAKQSCPLGKWEWKG